MTSNIGAELIKKEGAIGFSSRTDEDKARQIAHDRMKEKLLDEMKKTFRPEFINRLDSVAVFHHLTQEHIRQIVDLLLRPIRAQLEEKGIRLEVTEAAKDLLSEKGYDQVYGARPLRRVMQSMVEDELSDAILREDFQSGDTVCLDRDGDEIKVQTIALASTPL